MQKTDIVMSKAGRDKGKHLIVLDNSDGYLYLADGKGREVSEPKRKKLKHCVKVGTCHERLSQKLLQGDKVTNSDIRRALREFIVEQDQKS